ncbi:hypothetical protein [Porphyromonas gingivalis]|uniref:Tail fiber protein n=1 Tax=Porphyromonas phage phage025a_SJD11 TaxID=3154115 RepID=A0AAT9JN34_9CAUD|nr:hypothetical protein [Porphyromonas gingivalis]OWR80749.1 hypothetical protein SJDPG11_03175 [Porphyromonas gingivalis SJD11]
MFSEQQNVLDLVAELDVAQAQLLEHVGESVNDLWDSFGSPHLSQKVSSLNTYLALIYRMEEKAIQKTGNSYVCDTIDIAFANSPFILPDPAVMEGRELSLFKSTANTYCGGYDGGVYVHYNASTPSSLRGGVVFGGSRDILQTTTTTPPANGISHSSISGCIAYFPRSENGTYALKEIACGEQIILTFRAVSIRGKHYWLVVNQSEGAAKLSHTEASDLLLAKKKVAGEVAWVAKLNGVIIPRTYITANIFSVTDEMARITYNGTSSRATMTVPYSLPDGFEFRVQNNTRYPLALAGKTIVGGIRSIPARSIYNIRVESAGLILSPHLKNLDSSTGE